MAYPLLSSLLFLTISNNFPFISQCNFIKHKLDHVSFAPKSFSSFYTWNSLISCHICSFQRLQAGWAASAWRHLHMLFWLSEHSSREPSWGWFLNITLSLKSPLCSEKFLFFCLFYLSRNFFPLSKRMLFMYRVYPKYQSFIISLVLLIRW